MKIKKGKILNSIKALLSFMSNDSLDDESNVDYEDPKSVKKFLEHNLKEGYLSRDEQKFVDELVDELDSSVSEEQLQETVKEIQLNEVAN